MKKKFKILIVDDDLLVHRIYTTLLTNKGYAVSSSSTAVGIFNTIANHAPDIILMDYQMPMVSGMEAIKLIKSSDLYKAIPIIFFSSVADLELLAREAGADTYVSKFCSSEELLIVVKGVTARLLR